MATKIKKFERPEDINALDDEALGTSIDEAVAYGQELASKDDVDLTKDEIAELDAIGTYLDEAEALRDTRASEAKERADKLAALRAKVAPRKADDSTDAGEGDEDEGDNADDDPGAGPGEHEDNPDAPPAEPQQAASLKKTTASRAARRSPDKTPQGKPSKVYPQMTLKASGEFGGFTAGQQFTNLFDAGKAITARLNSLPKGYQKDTQLRMGALSLDMPVTEFHQDNRDYRNDTELFYAASREARLEGKSLTAAGGWGAPSERALDFCELESIDGLFQVPEVTITRGGVQYTKGPTFADVFNSSTGFWDMTEAVAEAGVVQKTSLRPAVPGFIEKRLDAVGVMMEAGLLLRAGWPELVERYARLLLSAHKVKLAQKAITQIIGYTGAPVSLTNGFGNAMDIVHLLSMVAIGERQRNNMSDNQTLEVVLPSWVKEIIRVDLAQRAGVDTPNVSDAEITGYFTTRNMRPQFIRGWQNLAIDGTANVAITYPDTVDVLMYPAGTYVRGVADVIQLDTIYDSVNLKKNDYVHLFVEQGTLMTNPCGDGRHLRIPSLANGRRAAVSDANDNFANAPVA
jgi:hypothetical protein